MLKLNITTKSKEITIKKDYFICSDGTEFEYNYDAKVHELELFYHKIIKKAMYQLKTDRSYRISDFYDTLEFGVFKLENEDEFDMLSHIFEEYKNDYLVKFNSNKKKPSKYPCKIVYVNTLEAYIEIDESNKKLIKKMIRMYEELKENETGKTESFELKEVSDGNTIKYEIPDGKIFSSKYKAKEKLEKMFYKYVPKVVLDKDHDETNITFYYIKDENEFSLLKQSIGSVLQQCCDLPRWKSTKGLTYPALLVYNGFEGTCNELTTEGIECFKECIKK